MDKLNIGVLLPYTRGWPVGFKIASGVILGLEELQNRDLLPNVNITWEWRDTHCAAQQGVSAAVDLYQSLQAYGGIDAFIGGGCSTVCQPVGLFSGSINIPQISFGCTSPTLSDKSTFTTFTRASATYTTLAPMYLRLVQEFLWNRIAIITTPQAIWSILALRSRQVMEAAGMKVFFHSFDPVGTDPVKISKMKAVVSNVKSEAKGMKLVIN